MAGWNLKSGGITEYNPSEERIWSLFNFVFSDTSRKRNTYKFGLIKALLDNVFNVIPTDQGVDYTYEQLFLRFTENYWNLVVRYNLRQMRRDGKSEFSRIESIIKSEVEKESILQSLEFVDIDEERKKRIIQRVLNECKRNVIGALYEDFDGVIYSFDLRENTLVLNRAVYDFMLMHKTEIERLNYYAWAKFLEQINDAAATVRLIDKLELSTPKRENLSVYREILRFEFEEKTCFYCGRKLRGVIHVDHFIPWSFVKDDKIWNFVLACPECNQKKNKRIPEKRFIVRIEDRNRKICTLDNDLVKADFQSYSEGLLSRIWKYAYMSGIKEYIRKYH